MTLVPTTKGKIMTSMDDSDRQGRTVDKSTICSRFSGPLFYSDAHARHLLSFGTRYVNVFTYRADVPDAETRHIPGPAHSCRDALYSRSQFGPAVYRIVVKPKRVSA